MDINRIKQVLPLIDYLLFSLKESVALQFIHNRRPTEMLHHRNSGWSTCDWVYFIPSHLFVVDHRVPWMCSRSILGIHICRQCIVFNCEYERTTSESESSVARGEGAGDKGEAGLPFTPLPRHGKMSRDVEATPLHVFILIVWYLCH